MSALLLFRCGSCTRGATLLAVNCSRLPFAFSRSSLKTSVLRFTHEKTAVQKWGWQYLLRQQKLKRPISPHLTVYKPQLTWMLSGLHRILGTAMVGAIAVLSIGLMVAPFDFPQLIEWIRQLGLHPAIVYAVKWMIAWPLTFHAINGVRFLGFDVAMGMDLRSVYKTGWLVVGISIAFATLIAFYQPALRDYEELPKKNK